MASTKNEKFLKIYRLLTATGKGKAFTVVNNLLDLQAKKQGLETSELK